MKANIKRTLWAAVIVSITCGCFTPPVHAEVTSSAVGERFFVRWIPVASSSGQAMVRFQKCEVQNTDNCERLGQRDYSPQELRSQRSALRSEVEKMGKFRRWDIFKVVLGTIGGMLAGCGIGAPISAALATTHESDPLAGAIGAIVGCGFGVVIGGTIGGIVTYKLVKRFKRKKIAKILSEAKTLDEDILLNKSVAIDGNIDTFVNQLKDALSALPIAEPQPQQQILPQATQMTSEMNLESASQFLP